MVCEVGAAAFRLLSVRTSEPLREPAAVGTKLMGNWQNAPGASVPAAEEPLLISGQADAAPVLSVKFAVMLGLLPLDGIGKLNAALPTFSTVTVFGLSVLVAPTAVLAKVRLGGSAKSSSNARLFCVSAT